jgi:predicted esterase
MQATKQETPFEVYAFPQAAAAVLDFSIVKTFYEKGAERPFGYATVTAPGFDATKPVRVVIVLHGQGECGDGSLPDLRRMMAWGGWYVDAKHTSLLGAVNRWPVVYMFVQTSSTSKFASGEIDFILDEVNKRFVTLGALPVVVDVSLGGFGFINWGDGRPDRIKRVYRVIHLMPGGNGSIGHKYGAAAAQAGVEHLFFHAADDTTARPAQSIDLNKAIIDNGGRSNLVLYSAGGHTISTRPMNAWFPWSSVNDTTFKTEPGSYRPTASMYDFLCAVESSASLGCVVTDASRKLEAFAGPDGVVVWHTA